MASAATVAAIDTATYNATHCNSLQLCCWCSATNAVASTTILEATAVLMPQQLLLHLMVLLYLPSYFYLLPF